MERRTRLLALVALPLLAAAACVGALGQSDVIAYSHRTHLRGEAGCVDCHADIDRADTLLQTYLPTHDVCVRCHDEKDMERCDLCHSSPNDAKRTPPRHSGLEFAHSRHMEAVNGNCVRCHFDIPSASRASESKTPGMATCTEVCHAKDLAQMRCRACHSDLSRYRLEDIRFVAHTNGFEKKHGSEAQKSSDTCAQCHERSFCSDCHSNTQILGADVFASERATRNFIHPAPYVSTHAIDARSRADACQTCHRPNFCVSCHASFGIAATTHAFDAIHPTGWLDPGSSSFHGRDARRDPTTCAACHERGAQTVCVRCHKVGGTGGNPHPPGFARSGAPADNRMCRVCHERRS